MLVSDFDYLLPAAQIAQRPLEARDASRMLVLPRDSGESEDRKFAELPNLLRGDELVVINNARVIPARLFGRRVDTPAEAYVGPPSSSAAEVEILLSRRIDDSTWEALVRPGRKMRFRFRAPGRFRQHPPASQERFETRTVSRCRPKPSTTS